MNKINRGINTGLAIALIATTSTLMQTKPASAQILDIAAGALNALLRSKQPQPQVIQQQVPVPVPAAPSNPDLNVGTNNANGNNFNLCISNCLPNSPTASSSPVNYPATVSMPQQMPQQLPQQLPQQIAPAPIAQQQQQSVASTTVMSQNGSLPPCVVPQPQTLPPNNPTLNIPPIGLPVNLPR
jgi:hypothetical protein